MSNLRSYPHRSGKLPPRNQLIMGMQALHEMLRYHPQRLIKVFTAAISARHRKNDLLHTCEQNQVPVEYVSEDLLTKMTGSDAHQSFVAHIQGRKFYDVAQFLQEIDAQERCLVVILSEIFDPQNFGAILRSAECFGVDGVVWSKNRGCDITPMVTKASCGGSELLRLIRISNLANAVDQLKVANFQIVAAIADSKALPFSRFKCSSHMALILGSEGEGIQPLLCKKADAKIFIPIQGKIESLNVAQAAAVLLSRLSLSE
jgi:23S rRNA (guanosine2251-2'-O)-methyltransferase